MGTWDSLRSRASGSLPSVLAAAAAVSIAAAGATILTLTSTTATVGTATVIDAAPPCPPAYDGGPYLCDGGAPTTVYGGALAVGSTAAGLVALETNGVGGVSTTTPTAWANGASLPRFRLCRPNPDPAGDPNVPPCFTIVPYQYGIAFEYGSASTNGVVEWWVDEFSIHKGPGKGGNVGGILWVGDDTDAGGVRATSRNYGGQLWSEVSSESFDTTTHGDLRLRVVDATDCVSFLQGTGASNTERASVCGAGEATFTGAVTATNSTAATVGAPSKPSPGVVLHGEAWDTDGAVSDQLEMQTIITPSSDTTTYATWQLQYRQKPGGGAFGAWTALAQVLSNGTMTVINDLAVNGGDISGPISTVTFAEVAEPAAPAANGAVLYSKDSGGGKSQLCVRFASGASQCFATEP